MKTSNFRAVADIFRLKARILEKINGVNTSRNTAIWKGISDMSGDTTKTRKVLIKKQIYLPLIKVAD